MAVIKSCGGLDLAQMGSHASTSATPISTRVLPTTTASSSFGQTQTVTGTRCWKRSQRCIPEVAASISRVPYTGHKRQCSKDATGPTNDGGSAHERHVVGEMVVFERAGNQLLGIRDHVGRRHHHVVPCALGS